MRSSGLAANLKIPQSKPKLRFFLFAKPKFDEIFYFFNIWGRVFSPCFIKKYVSNPILSALIQNSQNVIHVRYTIISESINFHLITWICMDGIKLPCQNLKKLLLSLELSQYNPFSNSMIVLTFLQISVSNSKKWWRGIPSIHLCSHFQSFWLGKTFSKIYHVRLTIEFQNH